MLKLGWISESSVFPGNRYERKTIRRQLLAKSLNRNSQPYVVS